MKVAARWVGWWSLALASAGGICLWTGIAERTSDRAHHAVRQPEYDWRQFAVADEQDEAGVQACFDRHSGIVAIERDDNHRASTIVLEADGPLVRCLDAVRTQRGLRDSLRPAKSPVGAYFHSRVRDPWAPPSEPALFPPVVWHRCPASAASPSKAGVANVRTEAEACLLRNDVAGVQLELLPDGRVGRVRVDDIVAIEPPVIAARTECLVRTFCQSRFDPSHRQPMRFALVPSATP